MLKKYRPGKWSGDGISPSSTLGNRTPISPCLVIIARHTTAAWSASFIDANGKQWGRYMSVTDCRPSAFFYFARGTSWWGSLTQHHPNIAIWKPLREIKKEDSQVPPPTYWTERVGGWESSGNLYFTVPWVTYVDILKQCLKMLAPKKAEELHGLLRCMSLHYIVL